jgi:hypothetical protein
MSCPAWEDCNKKACIEQSKCTDQVFWSRFWSYQKINNTSLWRHRINEKKQKKRSNKLTYLKDKPSCVRTGDWCDKKLACDVLGQCIMEVPRIKANDDLMQFLKGPHTPGGIVALLKHFDPEPMASYYPLLKCVKK